jgi:hypothetical protein
VEALDANKQATAKAWEIKFFMSAHGATWEQTDRALSLFSREVQERRSWIPQFDAARMERLRQEVMDDF